MKVLFQINRRFIAVSIVGLVGIFSSCCTQLSAMTNEYIDFVRHLEEPTSLDDQTELDGPILCLTMGPKQRQTKGVYGIHVSDSDKKWHWNKMRSILNGKDGVTVKSLPAAIFHWLKKDVVQTDLRTYGGTPEALRKIWKDLCTYNKKSAPVSFLCETFSTLCENLNELLADVNGYADIDIDTDKVYNTAEGYNEVAKNWFDSGLSRFLKCCVDGNVPGVRNPFNYVETHNAVESTFRVFKKITRVYFGLRGPMEALSNKLAALEHQGLPRREVEPVVNQLGNALGALASADSILEILDFNLYEDPEPYELSLGEAAFFAGCDLAKVGPIGAAVLGPLAAVAVPAYIYYDLDRLSDLVGRIRKLQTEICFLQMMVSCFNVAIKETESVVKKVNKLEHKLEGIRNRAVQQQATAERRTLEGRNVRLGQGIAQANRRADEANQRNNRTKRGLDNERRRRIVGNARARAERDAAREEARAATEEARIAREETQAVRVDGERIVRELRNRLARHDIEFERQADEFNSRCDELRRIVARDVMANLIEQFGVQGVDRAAIMARMNEPPEIASADQDTYSYTTEASTADSWDHVSHAEIEGSEQGAVTS